MDPIKVKAVQKTSKKIKKGLDKQKPKCYNKDVNKQNKSTERNEELSYG